MYCSPYCDVHCCNTRARYEPPHQPLAQRPVQPFPGTPCPYNCRIRCTYQCPWRCCFNRRSLIPPKPREINPKILPITGKAAFKDTLMQVHPKANEKCLSICKIHCTSHCPPSCCFLPYRKFTLKNDVNRFVRPFNKLIKLPNETKCPAICSVSCQTECPRQCCRENYTRSFILGKQVPRRQKAVRCPAGCKMKCRTDCPWECCLVPYRRA